MACAHQKGRGKCYSCGGHLPKKIDGGWLDKYENGGDIPPTRTDSLNVLNNSLQLQNYYGAPYITNFDAGRQWRAEEVNKENREFVKQKIAENKFQVEDGFAEYESDGAEKGSTPLKYSDYYQEVSPYTYKQRDNKWGEIDLESPMQLFDKRIAPTGRFDATNMVPFTRGMGDMMSINTYDPISVTPWDMLSAEDKIERRKKYGDAGTPYAKKKVIKDIPEDKEDIRGILTPDNVEEAYNEREFANFSDKGEYDKALKLYNKLKGNIDSPTKIPKYTPNEPETAGEWRDREPLPSTYGNSYKEKMRAYNDSLNVYNKGLKDFKEGKFHKEGGEASEVIYGTGKELEDYIKRDYDFYTQGRAKKAYKNDGVYVQEDGTELSLWEQPVGKPFPGESSGHIFEGLERTKGDKIQPTSYITGAESVYIPLYTKPTKPRNPDEATEEEMRNRKVFEEEGSSKMKRRSPGSEPTMPTRNYTHEKIGKVMEGGMEDQYVRLSSLAKQGLPAGDNYAIGNFPGEKAIGLSKEEYIRYFLNPRPINDSLVENKESKWLDKI